MRTAGRRERTQPVRRTLKGFPRRVLKLLAGARMLGIRAGAGPHRSTGIWFVLLGDRVFVRPWNDKSSGWRRAFLNESRGAVSVSGREILVRARTVRGERLWDAVDAAYAEKYNTPASRKWVRGFATARRRRTTTELLPLARSATKRRLSGSAGTEVRGVRSLPR